jgi:hypothetical protein
MKNSGNKRATDAPSPLTGAVIRRTVGRWLVGVLPLMNHNAGRIGRCVCRRIHKSNSVFCVPNQKTFINPTVALF